MFSFVWADKLGKVALIHESACDKVWPAYLAIMACFVPPKNFRKISGPNILTRGG